MRNQSREQPKNHLLSLVLEDRGLGVAVVVPSPRVSGYERDGQRPAHPFFPNRMLAISSGRDLVLIRDALVSRWPR